MRIGARADSLRSGKCLVNPELHRNLPSNHLEVDYVISSGSRRTDTDFRALLTWKGYIRQVQAAEAAEV